MVNMIIILICGYNNLVFELRNDHFNRTNRQDIILLQPKIQRVSLIIHFQIKPICHIFPLSYDS